MSAMWKWVMLAAFLYGTLAVAVALSPRTAALGQILDLAAVSDSWQVPQHMPTSYDFESTSTPPITRPPADVEVVTISDDNHVLRWNTPFDAPLAFLGLPIAPPVEGASLELRLRSSHMPTGMSLVVGIHERDGSLYATHHQPAQQWQQLSIPWAAFKLAQSSKDENTILNATEIDGIFIALRNPSPLRDEHLQQSTSPPQDQHYGQRRRPQRDHPPTHQPPQQHPSQEYQSETLDGRFSSEPLRILIEIDDVTFSSPVTR